MARRPIILDWTEKKRSELIKALENGGTRSAVFSAFGISPRTYQNYMRRGRRYRDATEEERDQDDKPFYDLMVAVQGAEGIAENALSNSLFKSAVGETRGKVKVHYPLGKLERIAKKLKLGKRPPLSSTDALLDWLDAIAAHEEAPAGLAVELEAWIQKDNRSAQYLLQKRYRSSGWGTAVDEDEAEKQNSTVFL